MARNRQKSEARKAARAERKRALAESEWRQDYLAKRQAAKLFAEGNRKSKKCKKTTDAIVSRQEGIVFEADGRTPKLDSNGQVMIVGNARKGPSGKTRFKTKDVGINPRAEHTAQERIVEYTRTTNMVTAQVGFVSVREVRRKDGSTFQVLSANAQAAINKGLVAADGSKVVRPASGMKGNPVGPARTLNAKAPLLNPPAVNPVQKPEMRPLERDMERNLPVPPVHRNEPARPVKPFKGTFDANEDFPPMPSRKARKYQK